MKLVLPADYPQAPPKGYFLTKIFHPNISKAGEICVNTLKKDWKPDLGIGHVLQVVRCLLINPFPESALNDEAGKLFMTSYDQYAQRARLMTDLHAPKIQPPARAATPTALGDNNGESQPGPDAAALEKKESMKFMKAYFKQLKKLTVNPKLEARIRFMIRDLCELRDDLWKPRREVETALDRDAEPSIECKQDIQNALSGFSQAQRRRRGPPRARARTRRSLAGPRARRGARAHERGGREGVHPLRGVAP